MSHSIPVPGIVSGACPIHSAVLRFPRLPGFGDFARGAHPVDYGRVDSPSPNTQEGNPPKDSTWSRPVKAPQKMGAVLFEESHVLLWVLWVGFRSNPKKTHKNASENPNIPNPSTRLPTELTGRPGSSAEESPVAARASGGRSACPLRGVGLVALIYWWYSWGICCKYSPPQFIAQG